MKKNRIREAWLLCFLWLTAVFLLAPLSAAADGGESEAAQEAQDAPVLSAEEKQVGLGTGWTVRIVNFPEGGKVKSWTSSDPAIASVASEGRQARVTAHAPGKVTITAALKGGIKLRCRVKVPKVSLSQKEVDIGKGNTAVLKLKGTKAVGKWSSSAKKVASVSVGEDGTVVVKGKKYGEAVIAVTCESVSLKCKVHVMDPKLSKKFFTILQGDSYRLTAERCSGKKRWHSTNGEAAYVSSNGTVTARGEGKAVIMMTANGVTTECKVKVVNAGLKKSEVEGVVGEVIPLKVSGNASGTWSAEDSSMVSFASDGSLVARKSGEVKLTYTVGVSSRSCYAVISSRKASSYFAAKQLQRKIAVSSLRDLALGEESHYRFMQGCATDGKYGYFVLSESGGGNVCAMIKMRLSDWKVVKVRTGLPIFHGNDLTYDTGKKMLVAVHAEGDYKGISYIDPNSLTVEDTRHLDEEVYCVGYNSKEKLYAFGVSGTNRFVIKNRNLETIREFQCLRKQDYTRQGMDGDNSYIYILQSNISEGKNRVMVYTWKGSFVTQIVLKGTREGESLFHVGQRVVITYNDTSFGGGNMLETALRRSYQLRYTGGGASGSMEQQSASLDENVRLAENLFRQEDCRFIGWMLTRASDGKVCCRTGDGDVLWLKPEEAVSVIPCLVADGQKVGPMTRVAGDIITLEAQWE